MSTPANGAGSEAAPGLSNQDFLDLCNRFIDLANRVNGRVSAPDIALPFLYAAARYAAFIGRGVERIENEPAFVAELTGRFRAMLEQHLADPALRR